MHVKMTESLVLNYASAHIFMIQALTACEIQYTKNKEEVPSKVSFPRHWMFQDHLQPKQTLTKELVFPNKSNSTISEQKV